LLITAVERMNAELARRAEAAGRRFAGITVEPDYPTLERLTQLVEAGKIRVRPILMTTLCTLFGLLPLALGLGSGAELQKPLALAVIGGLSISTFITLLVMPVLYSLLERKAGSQLQVAGERLMKTEYTK